jgi:hypothetical protein
MSKSLARKFALGSAVAFSLLSFATSSEAATLTYFASLSGITEIPPNASPGAGDVAVYFDEDTMFMTIDAAFSGLLGTTTAAHIHCCLPTASGNVGVATVLPTFTGFPLGVTSGTYNHTFDMALASSYNPAFVTAQGSISAALAALLDGMETGNAYFNIHTTAFPGGEIRGNITAAVPLPAAFPLLAAGLSAMGFMGWRRKRKPLTLLAN